MTCEVNTDVVEAAPHLHSLELGIGAGMVDMLTTPFLLEICGSII